MTELKRNHNKVKIEIDQTTYIRPIMKMQLQENPAYAIRWLIHYHALISKIVKSIYKK